MTQIQATNNISGYALELDAAAMRGALNGCNQIALLAQELAPVDTGSLRDTIDVDVILDERGHHEYSINAGNLEGGYAGGSQHNARPAGTPVDYADAQEFGMTHAPNHPFMTPASEQGFPLLQDAIAEAIRAISE